jgi:hypothetical protein
MPFSATRPSGRLIVCLVMKTLEEKQRARLLYLKTLYDKTNGGESDELDMWELGEELGFSAQETSAVLEYLAGEGLLANDVSQSGVSLSHAGVVEVEQAMQAPEQPTQHFPLQVVHNVIHVDKMVNSQILQGSPGATQTGTFSAQDMNTILHWAAEVRKALPQLTLASDDLTNAEANLATIEAQAKARKPNPTILSLAGVAIRGLLEAAAKGAATAIGTTLCQHLIASLPTVLAVLP